MTDFYLNFVNQIQRNMSIISCRDVVKKFGDHTALNSVNVEIPEGKIYGLLGPNGAGKTTLIRIINHITVPDSGSVIFNGHPLCEEDVLKIGYLPEERGLYKKMKVGEQAVYLARLKGLTKGQAEAELKKWFVRFGIQSWWGKKVEELSKGMAQKVQFITTVMHRPSLIILDEPFSGFDPVNAQLIRNEILRLRDEGTTVVLSTHNMESVEELCDNITLINKSNVVIQGPVGEIRKKYGNNNVEVLYRSTDTVPVADNAHFSVIANEEYEGSRRLVLSVAGGTVSADILKDLISAGLDIVSYRELMPRMNDIFIKLVTQGAQL